jgi:hypothetical protein
MADLGSLPPNLSFSQIPDLVIVTVIIVANVQARVCIQLKY